MEVKGIEFINSLNYFTTTLANLPRIFFSSVFDPENQGRKEEVPDLKYYDPRGMKADWKKDFEEW